MLLLLLVVGCVPAPWRMPGPLDRLGRGAPEPLSEFLARKAGSTDDHSGRPRGDVAAAAESFLGDSRIVVNGETYRFDCSGLVEASLAKAGCAWTGSSAMLYDAAKEAGVLHHRKRPNPGDIAFFDNTYDRDKNGANDDARTHSAVVTDVEPDGTVLMVHVASTGVVHLRMNLLHPHDQVGDGGAVLNDYLRARSKRDPLGTEYLAGELWVGFATFE
ncbi:hypothetical protein LBMAG42_20310 [Deltaproteobacteria bacterium]|nr:hypothetical protein LBMAG42_20310 [Deltaproteobacteria bacterium]